MPVQLFRGQAHVSRTERNVFPNRLFKELVLRILEYQPYVEPDVPQGLLASADILPAEEDPAPGGFQQPD